MQPHVEPIPLVTAAGVFLMALAAAIRRWAGRRREVSANKSDAKKLRELEQKLPKLIREVEEIDQGLDEVRRRLEFVHACQRAAISMAEDPVRVRINEVLATVAAEYERRWAQEDAQRRLLRAQRLAEGD